MSPKKTRLRGFSLIELMLVVAIIGVLAAVAAPAYNQATTSRRAAAELNKVEKAIAAARDRARVTICRTQVSIDIVNSTITWQNAADETDPDCPTDVESKDLDETLVQLSAITVGGAATNPFIFDKTGATDYGTRGVLQANNLFTAGPIQIEIWPAIGSIEVVR